MKRFSLSSHFAIIVLGLLLVGFRPSPAQAANNAEIQAGASSVPGSMSPGATAQVRIRVRNSGSTTWRAGTMHRLGTGSTNQVSWGGFGCGGYKNSLTDARVFLCNDVPPGATYDFNFSITVPGGASGSVRLAVRMVQDGVQWFGQSYSWNITVGGGGCPTNPISTPSDRWKLEIFNSRSLSGSPVEIRTDKVGSGGFTFNWGNGRASNCTGNDNFGIRFSRRINITSSGTYKFTTTTDDGVKLWVDGQLIINKWIDQGPTSHSGSKSLSAGWHNVRMDYYENGGGAYAAIKWEKTGGGGCPTSPISTPSDRWKLEIFNNRGLSGSPVEIRTDKVGSGGFTFDWGNGRASNCTGNDNFGIRFSRRINITSSGTYKFTTTTDDGVKLWVDGQLIINRWIDQAPTSHSGSKSLSTGWHDVRMDYYENAGGAYAAIRWEKTGGGGVCPAGKYDIADYVLGDSPNMRVYSRMQTGHEEEFAYRAGGNVSGLTQHFFVKNSSGENWEEFGYDANLVYRYRDTSWGINCDNQPSAPAYYGLRDSNRSSFAKWAPRCMSVGQSWWSDVQSRVDAGFKNWNGRCDFGCTSKYEGVVTQGVRLIAHHSTWTTHWGLGVPDVIELKSLTTGDHFYYAKAYGLVGFRGDNPAGGYFHSGAHRIDPGGHGAPNFVPLCGSTAAAANELLASSDPLVDYTFDEQSVSIQGVVPNSAQPGTLEGRIQGDAQTAKGACNNRSGALQLDGDTAQVVIEESERSSFRNGIQVEAFLLRESNESEDGIAGQWDGENGWVLSMHPEGDGRLVFTLRLENGKYASIDYYPPDGAYLQTWVHVAARYHVKEGLRLFWNGAEVARKRILGKPLSSSSHPIRIGNSGDGRSPFHGRLDEVKISKPRPRRQKRR